jgi:hypothetical protein
VAYERRVLLEIAARGLEGEIWCTAPGSLAVGRLRATSIIIGFANTIVLLLVEESLKRGGQRY